MDEENYLKEKLESQLITRSFNASGMPLVVWDEINLFCKDYYGDVRWVMVKDLVDKAKSDYKYAMLYDELLTLKAEVAELKLKIDEPKKEVSRFKSFGHLNVSGD